MEGHIVSGHRITPLKRCNKSFKEDPALAIVGTVSSSLLEHLEPIPVSPLSLPVFLLFMWEGGALLILASVKGTVA